MFDLNKVLIVLFYSSRPYVSLSVKSFPQMLLLPSQNLQKTRYTLAESGRQIHPTDLLDDDHLSVCKLDDDHLSVCKLDDDHLSLWELYDDHLSVCELDDDHLSLCI